MRRSRFLKYVSIAMMITGILRLFFGFMMLNLYTTSASFGKKGDPMIRLAGITFFVCVLSFAADLVCGFLGALNWEEPLRAKTCVIWGASALTLGLCGNILQILLRYGVSYVAWITGLIMPLLFLIAAIRFHTRSNK